MTKAIVILRWILLLPVTILGAASCGALAAYILSLFTSELFFFSSYIFPAFIQKVIVGVVSGAAIVIIAFNIAPKKNQLVLLCVVILGVVISLLATLGAFLESTSNLDIISNVFIGLTAVCFMFVPIKTIMVFSKDKIG